MRTFALAFGLLLTTLIGVFAAQDQHARISGNSRELLVFEHPDCTYCKVFRRDVLPLYRTGTETASTPIRFIDIERTDISTLPLRTPVQMVPTFVVVQDGIEIDRISGYWSPDNFFKMLTRILARAE